MDFFMAALSTGSRFSMVFLRSMSILAFLARTWALLSAEPSSRLSSMSLWLGEWELTDMSSRTTCKTGFRSQIRFQNRTT